MKAAPRVVDNFRWRVLLPVLMLVVSAFLFMLARKEGEHVRPGMGMGWEVRAQVINSFINGPGFWLSGPFSIPMPDALARSLNYHGHRLPGIVFFWFLIGWSIDRRKNRQALDQDHPLWAGVLFTALALGCAWLCLKVALRFHESEVGWLVLEVPRLRSFTAMDIGLAVWLLSFALYFVWKSASAVRKSFFVVR